MNGSTPNFKYRGIIPRAITGVFQEVGRHYEDEYTLSVSYLEIYNEQVRDLLSDEDNTNISIQDDSKGEVHVKGIVMQHVKNEEEALNCLFEGETRKTFGASEYNANSSRAHALYTIHVESKSRSGTTEKVVSSRLNLVDLAGNERTKKLTRTDRMNEANYINKSLSFLE